MFIYERKIFQFGLLGTVTLGVQNEANYMSRDVTNNNHPNENRNYTNVINRLLGENINFVECTTYLYALA